MLKTTRSIIGLLTVMVMLMLSLAACGNDTPAATTAAGGSTTSAAATTSAATTTTTAAGTTTTVAMSSAATTTVAGTTTAAMTSAATTTTAAGTATTTAASATTATNATTAATGGTASAVTACDKPVAAASNGKTYFVGIAVQNTIPALQNAIDGFKKGMAQCGFVEGKNVKYDLGNALGDIPSLAAIGRKFADEKVDLILAVGTAALTNMYSTTKDNNIPIIFNSVTSPTAALPDVIKSLTDHSYITGVQAFPPVADGLKLMQQVAPKVKNIGIIYNPTETNAVVQVKEAQNQASKFGYTITTQTIQGSGEVLTAAQSLSEKVDGFMIVTDVTTVNALDSLVKVCTDNKKPLVGLDPTSAPRGVIAAVGFNYGDNGIASAKQAADVLDGKKPNDIKIGDTPTSIAVNTKAAELMGVTIPDSLLSQAAAKYTDITQKK